MKSRYSPSLRELPSAQVRQLALYPPRSNGIVTFVTICLAFVSVGALTLIETKAQTPQPWPSSVGVGSWDFDISKGDGNWNTGLNDSYSAGQCALVGLCLPAGDANDGTFYEDIVCAERIAQNTCMGFEDFCPWDTSLTDDDKARIQAVGAPAPSGGGGNPIFPPSVPPLSSPPLVRSGIDVGVDPKYDGIICGFNVTQITIQQVEILDGTPLGCEAGQIAMKFNFTVTDPTQPACLFFGGQFSTEGCATNGNVNFQFLNAQKTLPFKIPGSPECELICPLDVTIECGESTDPSNTGMATGPAECGVINYSDVSSGSCPEIITRTWTSDFASCEQIITVEDTTPPVISTTATDGADLGCNPTVTPPTFTVIDNCDDNLVATVNDGGVIQNGCFRSQTWTATVSDTCGNAADAVSITYNWKVDVTKPVIATTATDGADLGCNPTVTPPTFTVTDDCDDNLVASVSEGDVVIDGCFRSQTWTATVSDTCDNAADAVSITYNWKVDVTKPVIATTATDGDDLGCNPTVTPPTFTVTDDCDDNLVASVSEGDVVIDGCFRSQTWTATVSDTCDNAADAVSITYNWKVDVTKPVIATTATDGADLGCNPTVTPPTFTVTDDCDDNLVASVSEGDVVIDGCFRSQTWTATVSDTCDNAADAVSITYNWKVDVTKPVIATTATDGADLGCNPTVTPPTFTVTDDCDDNLVASVSEGDVVIDGCFRSQTWTATVSDTCDNAADAVSITYNWKVDVTKPVIATTATDGADLGCNPTVTPPTFTVTDDCDDNLVASVSEGDVVIDGCFRSQTWTATVSDTCDNAADAVSITYNWKVDVTKPVIATTATDGADLGCNPTVTPPTFTVTDDCDDNLVASVSEGDVVIDGCFRSQTWTATVSDTCDNAADAVSITYNWKVDVTKPVIATTATDGADLGCNPTVTPPTFTVTDDCDDNLVASVSEGDVVIDGCFRSQTWTATVSDTCDNAADAVSITYNWKVDVTKPVIATTATDGDDLGCNPTVTPPTFTVTDDCDDNLVASVSEGDVVIDGCFRSQTWTATVSDTCDNAADAVSITYNWKVDVTKPVIATTATDGDDLGCNPDTITPPTFTVTDDCDDNLVASVNDGGVVENGCLRSQTWTATVSDTCDNAADAVSITYNWKVDVTGPVLSPTPADVSVECDAIPEVPTVTAVDDCDGDVDVTFNEERSDSHPDCPHRYTITRTWSAVDECGNPSEHVQTIEVDDTTAPSIDVFGYEGEALCPTEDPDCDIAFVALCLCGDDSFPWGDVVVSDNCSEVDNIEVVVDDSSGDVDTAYGTRTRFVRTITATDECGNSTEVSICVIIPECPRNYWSLTQGGWSAPEQVKGKGRRGEDVTNNDKTNGVLRDVIVQALLDKAAIENTDFAISIGDESKGSYIWVQPDDAKRLRWLLPGGGPAEPLPVECAEESLKEFEDSGACYRALVKQGRFHNNKVAQYLALQLNALLNDCPEVIGLQPDDLDSLNDLLLADALCTLPSNYREVCETMAPESVENYFQQYASPINLPELPGADTVGDLLELARCCLAGVDVGIDPSVFVSAMDAFNEGFGDGRALLDPLLCECLENAGP